MVLQLRPATTEDELYVLSVNVWPSNSIPVCWEAAGAATEHAWVQDAVTTTWQANSAVIFTGWGTCQPGATGIHLPSPSYCPIVVAFGLPIVAYGLLYTLWLSLVGGIIVVAGIFGWALEPPDDPEAAHGDDHAPSDAGGELEAGAAGEAGEPVAEGEAPAADKEIETVG